MGNWDESYYWLWIPLVSFTMITFVGLTVVFMGEPGDLPYTIGRVHAQAYIPMDHVSPMVFASLFSILGKLKTSSVSGTSICDGLHAQNFSLLNILVRLVQYTTTR